MKNSMTRAEFRAALKPLVPSAEFSIGDEFTKMPSTYIDVTVPCADVPQLNRACKVLGKRAVFVSVLPYGGKHSHRRVDLTRTHA